MNKYKNNSLHHTIVVTNSKFTLILIYINKLCAHIM